jgi:hypothetical protein
MSKREDEGGKWAVRGDESIESDDTLSPDEKGEAAEDQPLPGPSEPKQPAPER